jgi:hypothetical protein
VNINTLWLIKCAQNTSTVHKTRELKELRIYRCNIMHRDQVRTAITRTHKDPQSHSRNLRNHACRLRYFFCEIWQNGWAHSDVRYLGGEGNCVGYARGETPVELTPRYRDNDPRFQIRHLRIDNLNHIRVTDRYASCTHGPKWKARYNWPSWLKPQETPRVDFISEANEYSGSIGKSHFLT